MGVRKTRIFKGEGSPGEFCKELKLFNRSLKKQCESPREKELAQPYYHLTPGQPPGMIISHY